MVSIFAIGGMIGALATGLVADRIGRKAGLLYNNVLVFIAAACMGFSKQLNSYELLILGRFVIGLNSGLNAGLGPMYLSEISPVHFRGAIGTIYQYGLLKIVVSIVFADVKNVPEYTFDIPAFVFTLVAFAIIYELAIRYFSLQIKKLSIKSVMLE